MRGRMSIQMRCLSALLVLTAGSCPAETGTNSAAVSMNLPQLPDAGPSVLRVMGALALVLGLFLGGAWLFKNWQRLNLQRGRAPKLNLLETRSLGGKHALYVVGYEQQRFLLSSSPGGVNLLSHLPAAEEEEKSAAARTPALGASFAQALNQVLRGNK